MSKKISAMPVLTTLAGTDSFTVLDNAETDLTLRNKQITKTNALAGFAENPPLAGNKLRDQGNWVAAGGAAVLNVGTTAGTVAEGDKPAAAVSGHTTAIDHGNIPTASQKAALNAATTLSSGDAVVAASVMASAISAAGHAAVTIADTATIDMALSGQQVSGSARVQMSVTSDANGLKLSGDSATPGATQLYGTDSGGTKGWYAQPAGGSGDATSIQGFAVTTTDPVDGNILVYRTGSSAYVMEAKPASGSTPSAADVTFTPVGTLAADDVQEALAELDSEKAAITSLGDAALLDVGQVAGTVAAGDDPRFSAVTAVGSGVDFFPTDAAIVPAGTDNTYPIKTLSNAPSGAAEDVDAIVIGAGTTAMYGTYLSPVLLNTQLDAGIWEFHVYAGVDSATGTTQLIQNVYRVRPASGTVTITGTGTSRTATASTGTPFATTVIDASASIDVCSFVQTPLGLYPITSRTSDTVVTITTPSGYTNESTVAFSVHKKLFGVTSGEINNLAGTGPAYTGIALLPEMQSVQSDFPLVAGDRLATAFLGTSTSARTLYFAHDGTQRYSKLHSPLEFVVDLASGVSGVLPVVNGGTGSATAASQAEMETGTETAVRAMSPLRVAQAIAALGGTGGAWDGDIADINLDGGTDIGADLADADLILVDDGAGGTNRKSALSRVWTYVLGKIASGIAPYLTGYTVQGKGTSATATDHYSGTTLTIPLDGRVYDFDFPDNNITIAFGSPPSTPTCTDTVLILKQRTSSTMYGIAAWPSGIKWPGGVAQTMPQTLSARMRVVISVSPSGIYDVSAMWMGV